jgi:preprotein translocase subunit YajC
MTAMELYELLNNAGIKYEVVEIFDGVRTLSIEVDEEENLSIEIDDISHINEQGESK